MAVTTPFNKETTFSASFVRAVSNDVIDRIIQVIFQLNRCRWLHSTVRTVGLEQGHVEHSRKYCSIPATHP
jgi:hypothetical protein